MWDSGRADRRLVQPFLYPLLSLDDLSLFKDSLTILVIISGLNSFYTDFFLFENILPKKEVCLGTWDRSCLNEGEPRA